MHPLITSDELILRRCKGRNSLKHSHSTESDFQDNNKNIPIVLTTSQKLITGVDAPEIRNIMLMRHVNLMIEFKQIVGRGTRLYQDKDYFTVYGFAEAHHYFKDPESDGEPSEPEQPH